MRLASNWAVILAGLFLVSCSNIEDQLGEFREPYLAKRLVNSKWEKQGVGTDEWYYRLTVIEAPANTGALGIADGHIFHPELIRFEITKDLLIGRRAHASVINADREGQEDTKPHYRGAPVVAYAIREHFDLVDADASATEPRKSYKKPWFSRAFISVDWSKNLVGNLTRSDASEGVFQLDINNSMTFVIDEMWPGNPKQSRIGRDFIEFTTRHAVEVSLDAYHGKYGPVYKGDSAAPMIDVRHSFMKKKPSDFIPLAYPDEIAVVDDQGALVLNQAGEPQYVPINKRFGFVRVHYDGRPIYVENVDHGDPKRLERATIFNIWQKSHDDDGKVIPIEARNVNPIIYYVNVLHPESLMDTSFRVAKRWNMVFKRAVFHAQPNKYKNVEEVPDVFILRQNDCHEDTIKDWLLRKRPDLKNVVELSARVRFNDVARALHREKIETGSNFTQHFVLESSAKRELEQLCAALEYHTRDSEKPFTYQRPGDLRFNLLNLETENNTTDWSGFGPMFADPISGEILSATANINLKYIDLRANRISEQIGLLTKKFPGIRAVFGPGALENAKSGNEVSELAMTAFRHRVGEMRETKRFERSRSKSPASLEKLSVGISHKEKTLINKALGQKTASQRNSVMDSTRFVDDMSLGIAIKYAHLSDGERFLKLRELVFEAVALHEIGHNIGLEHNMAASSDALNYGQNYWLIEGLPSDLAEAKSRIENPLLREQLEICLRDGIDIPGFSPAGIEARRITTQDCLQQKNRMASSVMDYHASSLSDIEGLGLYDEAAVKWAYGQLVEVFPQENIRVDLNKIALAHWLKNNDYREIPGTVLKNVQAINDRRHEPFIWDQHGAKRALPPNAVPYASCKDATGREGPRCVAFDFGPDMQASAQWQKARYWQQFVLSNFAYDSLVDFDASSLTAAALDMDILDRFTNMLRWYYYSLEHDPDFLGSHREQDYVKALAMGMNHFAHVIGTPESGAHISAPTWTLERDGISDVLHNRLAAAKVLVPVSGLSQCTLKSVSSMDERGKLSGRFDYRYAEVPLGAGRPFDPGIERGVDDKFLVYFGSMLTKKYALHLMTAPLSEALALENVEQSERLSLTWYHAFPEAVTSILSAIIGGHYEQIGPLVHGDGSIAPRDVVDEATLKPVLLKDQVSIMPAMDETMGLFATESVLSTMSESLHGDLGFLTNMRISCRGCSDDIDYADTGNDFRVARFRHLSGQEYQTAQSVKSQAIGAELLQRANIQKDHYLRLTKCVESEEARLTDSLCSCVKTSHRKTFDAWICCDESNEDCLGPELETVGSGQCTLEDLKRRREQSIDQLNATVGFIDNMRRLFKQANL